MAVVLYQEQSVAEVNTHEKTVLLVEDDPSAIAFAQEASGLCEPPIHLVVVEDSVEALVWLARSQKERNRMPGLILLDLKLPKLTGLAVLRRLRMDANTEDLPIIVFSELCEQADVLLSYQIGANSFVSKPLDISQFKQLLTDITAYWLQPRQRKLAL
ncbi:MAG: response regulator [Gallionellaceae bacterium]|nr:response regulator [Gallionellaceae bacterium]